MKRLFSVHGPTQALNILAIIENMKKKGDSTDSDFFYFAVYYTGVEDLNNEFYRVLTKMLSIVNYRNIIYLDDTDVMHKNSVLDKIKVSDIDELYLLRTWDILNEELMYVYPKAKTYLYGDSLGIMDSKDISNVDEIKLITPISLSTVFNNEEIKQKLNIIEKQSLISVMDQIIELFHEELFAITHMVYGDVLYLTNYYSQIEGCTIDEEITLYLDQIKELKYSHKIIIKKHPRENNGVSLKLLAELRKLNLFAEIIPEQCSILPAEIIMHYLKPSIVCGVSSTAFVGMKYIDSACDIIPMAIETLENRIKMNNKLRVIIHLVNEILKNIDTICSSEIYYVSPTISGEYLDLWLPDVKRREQAIRPYLSLLQYIHSEAVENNVTIVAYGAGSGYENLIGHFNRMKITVEFIVDSSSDKWGKNFYEVPVKEPRELLQYSDTNILLLITSSYAEEIINSLNEIGFRGRTISLY